MWHWTNIGERDVPWCEQCQCYHFETAKHINTGEHNMNDFLLGIACGAMAGAVLFAVFVVSDLILL